jgi:two-component system OmpR family sensor kinase
VRHLPIRVRVTLAFAMVMAIVIGALALFIYLRLQNELNRTIDQGLRSRGGDVGPLVARSGGGFQDPGSELDREESFAQVLTPDGGIVDATPQLSGGSVLTPVELDEAASGPSFFDRDSVPGLEGEARLLAQPTDADGRTLIVVVGASVDDRDESLASLLAILLIGGPVALLLASVAGYWMAGAALRPVEAMRSRAALISAAEPEARLPLPESDDELRRLGETLNQMLGRMEAALQRERAFVDDASHELRTPLAMHKTELELALRYAESPEEMRVAIASAIEEVDRLIALAEDLLVLARSEQGKLALELRQVGLSDVLSDVRERFAARAAEADRPLVIEPADRRARWRGGAPRRGPRDRVRAGVHRSRLRALQPWRSGPDRRRHRPRPGDRRCDRPGAPRQCRRPEPRRWRRRRLDSAARLSFHSRFIRDP